jgi:hypothetical protein
MTPQPPANPPTPPAPAPPNPPPADPTPPPTSNMVPQDRFNEVNRQARDAAARAEAAEARLREIEEAEKTEKERAEAPPHARRSVPTTPKRSYAQTPRQRASCGSDGGGRDLARSDRRTRNARVEIDRRQARHDHGGDRRDEGHDETPGPDAALFGESNTPRAAAPFGLPTRRRPTTPNNDNDDPKLALGRGLLAAMTRGRAEVALPYAGRSKGACGRPSSFSERVADRLTLRT